MVSMNVLNKLFDKRHLLPEEYNELKRLGREEFIELIQTSFNSIMESRMKNVPISIDKLSRKVSIKDVGVLKKALDFVSNYAIPCWEKCNGDMECLEKCISGEK